ncbi:11476_t:CDS:2 [Gigaspora margarita]|uniref:11476_t:CDS:1 n=1 Tax=Gigaspora margarita TaxID=4874 RepID=A0ABN7VBZ3_GIGMA|nr:11476_t:CDS:2 [Gigaspora margarita]
MSRRTRSKKVVIVSDSEHYSDSTGIDDENTPMHEVQVVITNVPKASNKKKLKNVPLLESSDSENDSVTKDEKDSYQPASSEEESEENEESEELSDSSDYSNKRKTPRRHVTSKKINYSEEKYYKKVHRIFDDFYEVLSSSEEGPPPTKQRKENNDDSLRSKRRPKRKSAKKSIDYDEKGYYKKFETALNAKLY